MSPARALEDVAGSAVDERSLQAFSSKLHVWSPGYDSAGGGIASFSRELASALAAQGRNPVLWAKDNQSGVQGGMKRHGSGWVPRALRTPVFATRLLAAAAFDRPDLVICTHPNLAPAAMLARQLSGIRYVAVAHGIDVHPGLSPMRRRALRGADAVWAVSRWTRQRCLDSGVAEHRIRVVGNTVDENRFDRGQRSQELRGRYAIGADEKVVLTVARLDPTERYKGYDKVVQALPRLREMVGPVRYLIVGQGADRTRVERLAAQCGVAEAVTFCGFVSDDALADHYRLADAFAMPSCGEGFGIVFLEAMACGIPVLGGDRDGTADALADGALGVMVDPHDVEAVAAGLGHLLRKHGPSTWFEPRLLRAACLSRHGREAFSARIADAMLPAAGRSD